MSFGLGNRKDWSRSNDAAMSTILFYEYFKISFVSLSPKTLIMLNKKLPAFIAAALFTMALFSACSESEKKTDSATDKKTAADSAAISPMDIRDTSKIDTTAAPRPLRPGN